MKEWSGIAREGRKLDTGSYCTDQCNNQFSSHDWSGGGVQAGRQLLVRWSHSRVHKAARVMGAAHDTCGLTQTQPTTSLGYTQQMRSRSKSAQPLDLLLLLEVFWQLLKASNLPKKLYRWWNQLLRSMRHHDVVIAIKLVILLWYVE
jgi:hypothetical protein